jgi:hypothetical protein
VSDALRTELERRISDYNFALERKYAFPGAVQVLDDVTRILPDDTWLTQLELHTMRGKDAQREMTLRGESANAGRLVALLEDSKLFTQAAPRSPTTKIQPGPGEIFDVSAHLAPQPPPTAMPLDLTAPIVRNPPATAAPLRNPPASSAPAAPGTAVPGAGAAVGAAAGAKPAASTAANPPASTGSTSALPGAAVAPTAPTALTRRAVMPGAAAPVRPAVPAEQPAEAAAPAPAAEPNDGVGPRPEE